jgi:excisionase family DNA binding protein
MAEEEKLFTVREMANKYRVSEETIRRWVRNKDIPYTPVGPFGLKRFKVTDPITQGTKNE